MNNFSGVLHIEMSTPCRILDDTELEGLQWRKDVKELQVNRAFGSDMKKFPRAFMPEVKTVFAYHDKRLSKFPRVRPEKEELK